MDYNITLLPFLIAFATTACATALLLPIITKFGILDDPKKHKHPAILHTKPIPRAGGLPIFIGIVTASLFFLPFNNMTITLLLAGFLSLIVGILDDKLDISPYVRFGVNIICAVLIAMAGASIPFITNPFGGILRLDTYIFPILPFINLGNVAAIIWIVWVTNMINWSTGVDGQMPGVVAISAIVIGILSLRFPLDDPNTLTAAVLSFILAGSAAGFLLHNFYPAKIFPGYGATSLYMLLAVVAILSGVKLATAAMVMAIPFIDGAFTIVRRIASGHSPFWHDNRHLHHLLLRLGFQQRSIALFYWTVSAIFGLVSLLLSSRGKLFAISMIAIVILGIILTLQIWMRRTHEKKNLQHA